MNARKKYYNFVEIQTLEKNDSNRLIAKTIFLDKEEFGSATEIFYALGDQTLDNHPNEAVEIDMNAFVSIDASKLAISQFEKEKLIGAQERVHALVTMNKPIMAVLATFH